MRQDGRDNGFLGRSWIVPFFPKSVVDTHGQTQRRGLVESGTAHHYRHAMTPLTTTMASALARVHPFHLIPRTSTYSTPLTYSCRRRAMMSAWSSRSATAAKSVPNAQPPLHDSPPIVIPTSNTPLSPDAASPQTAARPPPAPKATRPKPTLRPQKAALTLVSDHKSPTHPSLTVFFFRFYCVDTHGRGAFANPDEQSDAAAGPHRCPQ
jgi:hypothetical protein